MRLQAAWPQERLVAFVTLERLDARMHSAVVPQSADVSKLLAARRTHVRLLARVQLLVLLPTGREPENLSTLAALERVGGSLTLNVLLRFVIGVDENERLFGVNVFTRILGFQSCIERTCEKQQSPHLQ